MRNLFALACGIGASLGAAHAQTTISIGPRLGGNLATGTFNTPEQVTGTGLDYSYSRSAILSYQVGLAASIGWGHWAFQPALVLTEKGMKQEVHYSATYGNAIYTEDDAITSRVHYLELPLNVVYSFGANGEGFQLFGGPYVAVGVGGRATYEFSYNDPLSTIASYNYSGSQSFAFGSTFPDFDPNNTSGPDVQPQARRFDAGITAGVGYRRGPYQAQLGYGLGLLNVQPDYPASYQQPSTTGYLRTTQLTLSYYFPIGAK